MPKSNRDLCVEIIDSLPDDQLSRVFTLLKSIKFMSDEIFSDNKNTELTLGLTEDLDDLAEKLGVK